MKKLWKIISLSAVSVAFMGVRADGQGLDQQKGCSENAKQLVKKAWDAQPMNRRGNNGDPVKAESLYKEALKDSPECGSANMLLVALLRRNHDYEQANEFNERFLKHAPEDPFALSHKAALISTLKKDYEGALEIRIKLLRVEGFNNNGSVFYSIAATYSLMNRVDESLEYLKRALNISKGWGNEANAQADSDFENVRKDKKFWVLVNK
jgi:tetratricopeptide (TPR) repeat protein